VFSLELHVAFMTVVLHMHVALNHFPFFIFQEIQNPASARK